MVVGYLNKILLEVPSARDYFKNFEIIFLKTDFEQDWKLVFNKKGKYEDFRSLISQLNRPNIFKTTLNISDSFIQTTKTDNNKNLVI